MNAKDIEVGMIVWILSDKRQWRLGHVVDRVNSAIWLVEEAHTISAVAAADVCPAHINTLTDAQLAMVAAWRLDP